MKRILFNLLGFAAIAAVISSCKPMDKTYKALDGLPGTPKTLTYTLQAADYALLPATVPAKAALGFSSGTEAKTNIPAILNYKFFDYPTGSNANVTYTNVAVTIKLPDSLYSNIAYTVTNADYFSITVKYTDFSTAQAIAFLNA